MSRRGAPTAGPTRAEAGAGTAGDGSRPLRPEDLLVTERLKERPGPPLNLAAEAAAFRELSSLLVRRPRSVPKRFLEIVRRLCGRTGSAGLSELRTTRRGEPVLTPTEVCGRLAEDDLSGSEWRTGPFASCLQSRRAILLDRPDRLYPELGRTAPLVEVLVVPLLGRGRRPLGVVWAASHSETLRFSSTEAERLERLAPMLVLALTLRDAEEIRHGLEERVFSSTKAAGEARRLGALFDQAPGFIAVLRGPEHEFVFANKAYRRMVGRHDLAGRKYAEALPQLAQQGLVSLLDAAFASGNALVGDAVRVNLAPAGAEPREHYCDFVYQPVKNRAGRVQGIFVEGHDVTARVVSEDRARLISQEASHRVKNTLATVQAIAAHTARTSEDLAAFMPAFETRLIALARTNDLLIAHAWEGAPLSDVLMLELGLFQEKARIAGPPVMLTPPQAAAMGMIVHELVTNSSKYGAFSAPDGRVNIRWGLEADGQDMVLRWSEAGGPEVRPPAELGFGTKLINRLAERDLKGASTFTFGPEGLVCEITAVVGCRAS